METVYTQDYKGYTISVSIGYDYDAENPLDWNDANNWVGRDYDKNDNTITLQDALNDVFHGRTFGIHTYHIHSHGGEWVGSQKSYTTRDVKALFKTWLAEAKEHYRDDWDNYRAKGERLRSWIIDNHFDDFVDWLHYDDNFDGFVYPHYSKTMEELTANMDCFDEYIRGNVYDFVIEKDGEFIDSRSGFFGYYDEKDGVLEYAMQEIDSIIKQEQKQAIQKRKRQIKSNVLPQCRTV